MRRRHFGLTRSSSARVERRQTGGAHRPRRAARVDVIASNASATIDATVAARAVQDRKSTRLNSSHSQISYAVFCLKKKKKYTNIVQKKLAHLQIKFKKETIICAYYHMPTILNTPSIN